MKVKIQAEYQGQLPDSKIYWTVEEFPPGRCEYPFAWVFKIRLEIVK